MKPSRLLLVLLPFLLLCAATARAQEITPVEAGTTMRYLANTSDPGLALSWTQSSFNDNGWTDGLYGIGFDTNGSADGLLQTTVSGGRSIYTRATFQLTGSTTVSNVYIGADYDDGWAAWLNGVEIYRSPQLDAGGPSWNQTTGSHESSNANEPDYGTLIDVSNLALPALTGGENVLAVGVWNTSSSSSDLVLVPQLVLNNAVDLARGPYLQSGTDSGVVVRWRTDLSTIGRVWYGESPTTLDTIGDATTSTTDHAVELSGLQAETTYFYAIGDASGPLVGADADHFFVTAPLPGTRRPTRIWAIGDSGTADADARAVRDAYLAFADGRHTDLWLMLGDNAYDIGTDGQYQDAVFDVYPSLLQRSVLWPTIGNHDAISADSASQSGPYYDIFTLPQAGEAGGVASGTEAYYAFDHANIHFVVLDSAESDLASDAPMVTWLEQDLVSNLQDWTIALWHHPPYSHGSHDSDLEGTLIDMRENFVPLFEAHGVDLVLCGHSHSYERSFLIDGHYADSATFNATHVVDGGNGNEAGDGIYQKPALGPDPRQGAVYVVAGSSGKISGGPLDHPAMFASINTLGSVVIDVDGSRLDATFLDDGGTIRDAFSIQKGPLVLAPVAEFTADPQVGAHPMTVQFTDTSSELPDSWAWDFDDDGTVDSNDASPAHTYPGPGSYSVRLSASNEAGQDDKLEPGLICVTDPARVAPTLTMPDKLTIVWGAGPNGTTFDVAAGLLDPLLASAGDFTTAGTGLLSSGQSETQLTLPPSGSSVFLLVRENDCSAAGDWDSGGSGQGTPRDLGGL